MSVPDEYNSYGQHDNLRRRVGLRTDSSMIYRTELVRMIGTSALRLSTLINGKNMYTSYLGLSFHPKTVSKRK